MSIDTTVVPDEPIRFAQLVSDPTRQRIMQLCCCRWRSVGELVDALGGQIGQPTVSHHLAQLREAGLVDWQREGRHVLYTLNQERVAFCCGRLIMDLAPETTAAATLRKEEERSADGPLEEAG